MNARLIRLVALTCGVLLALPPAWCCYAAPCSAPTTKPEPATCCHKHKKEPARPAPSCPIPPADCPWRDHHTIAPTGPEKTGAGPALPAPVALTVLDTPRAGPAAAAAVIPLVLSRPLHLLQCLWLC
jgi:hypothetical protein